MSETVPTRIAARVDDPMSVYGPRDSNSAYVNPVNKSPYSSILVGKLEQFNVGMYSALVSTRTPKGDKFYTCQVGAFAVTPGFGYSDGIIIREGDRVIFSITDPARARGIILARAPAPYSIDQKHPLKVKSDTKQERRTNFFGNDCYRKKSQVYDTPLKTPTDISTARYINNRPTDLVPGEASKLNPHRSGIVYNMYSTSLVGGGSHIKLFSLENRIRVVADSIIKYTLFGNDIEWHNRRYLSRERAACMYQEERFGMKSKNQKAFEKCDYDDEFYFIKNKKKKQTLRPRIIEHEGYFGGLSTKYCLRPDPDSEEPRVMDDQPKDPGVLRESIDPSGQYRLAFTGMMGFERIGRIPVPVRIMYPWQKEAEEPKAETLKEFEHEEGKPFYRQLELADRVAYDVKNSYYRYDENKKEFYVPEESDLENKVKDIYDTGFTNSTTVKLEKYDKRRSGIWQGEDGSIIFRDAWGSEIVMIGGNIQLSCAGNIEILPGKTSLTIAGDDIVHKAQNSVDIEASNKDVRINGFKNVQVLAGADDDNPGGITLEAKGKSNPWDAKSAQGGEELKSSGILLKSHDGTIITDADKALVRASSKISIVAGKDKIHEGEGTISIVADTINECGKSANFYTEKSSLTLGESSATLVGPNVNVAAKDQTLVTSGSKMFVPLMMAPMQMNMATMTAGVNKAQMRLLRNEKIVSFQYDTEQLKKMMFKFRNSQECGTDKSWEIKGGATFVLYQPFWVQIKNKFETLKEIKMGKFEDHENMWKEETGSPWPGKDAIKDGKYAKLANDSPVNLDDNGFNNTRKDLQPKSAVTEVKLFDGYQVRAD